MDNKEIYKRTIGFSLRRLLLDILALIVVVAIALIGFLIAEATTNRGLIGLAIGVVIGLIAVAIFLHFTSYKYYAGQIAMMTRGITDKKLPDDVIAEGKRIVEERFVTVAAYFAATSIIKGIFNQIGRGITKLGEAIGGQGGETVGSVISATIQVIVGYLCDCCLGWVFYRKNVNAAKATCEGAVLFFKHGKTLAKNLGRIFGIGIASFVAIAGAMTGLFWLIFSAFHGVFVDFAAEIAEAATRASSDIPAFLTDPNTLQLACAAIVGIVIWGFVHSVFIRPFVLIGVLRNYINSGIKDIPDEKSFDELDKKSPKFKKLHAELSSK